MIAMQFIFFFFPSIVGHANTTLKSISNTLAVMLLLVISRNTEWIAKSSLYNYIISLRESHWLATRVSSTYFTTINNVNQREEQQPQHALELQATTVPR